MIGYLDDDGSLAYPPTPVLAETYADLDLMLLTATTDAQHWAALLAGTGEVLDRFEHLGDPKVCAATATHVIDQLRTCVQQFRDHRLPELAGWLTQVTDLLTAQQKLHILCADQIRRAVGHDATVAAIGDAADSLRIAAASVAGHRLADFPPYHRREPDYVVMGIALSALSAEVKRNPLRTQLAGAGGAAGSAEFNPYVAALCRLELATHRRLYRVLYRLAEHVGITLDDGIFEHPDDVDRTPLEKPATG